MKKQIFNLWMLLLMLVGGVNGAWAETTTGTNYSIDITQLLLRTGHDRSATVVREIPRFTITLSGAIKLNASNTILLRNGASIKIEPRRTNSGNVAKFRNIVLEGSNINKLTAETNSDDWTSNSTSATGTYSSTTKKSSYKFTNKTEETVSITNITLVFEEINEGVVEDKVTPNIDLSESNVNVELNSSTAQTATATLTESNPVFFMAPISYTFSAGGTGATLTSSDATLSNNSNANNALASFTVTVPTTATTGTATVTANFAGNDYYNAVEKTYTLYIIEPIPDIVTFAVNDDDIFLRENVDGGASLRLASSTFSRSNIGKYLRIKTNLGANITSSFMTTSYFSVTSSNPSVIDVSSYGVERGGSDSRVYYKGLEVKGTGVVTLTFTYNGEKTCTKTFNVVSCPTFSSYPYTWNFAQNQYMSSAFQTLKQTSYWSTVYGVNYAPKGANLGGTEEVSFTPTENTIDWINGLRFGGAVYLDYEHGAVQITGAGTGGSGNVTIPNVKAGYRITIGTEYGSFTIPETTNVTQTDGVYVVDSDGEASFQINGYISYIKVEKIASALTNRYSNRETFDFNGTGNSDINHMIGVNVAEGMLASDIQVTIEPADLLTLDESNKTILSGNYLSLWLTGQRVGTGTISVYYPGTAEREAAGPLIYNVRVIRSQPAQIWNFTSSDYWSGKNTSASTFSGDANWTADGSIYKIGTQVADVQLTANSSVVGATEGLYVTAKSNGVSLKVGDGGYMSLETSNASSIRIPSLVAGQHVVFRVLPENGECGITSTSGNMHLVNGQVSDMNSYFTFHVDRDGDGVFTRTNNSANLKIEYIEVIGATSRCNETKLVYENNTADISNTLVKVASGETTVPVKVSTASTGTVSFAQNDPNSIINSISTNGITLNSGNKGTAAILYTQAADGNYQQAYAVVFLSVKNLVTITLSAYGPFTQEYGTDFNGNSTVTGTASNGAQVYYKSSNERVAQVDEDGKVKCVGVGTATITAYTIESDDDMAGEASYTVTYTTNSDITFHFLPNSGFVNLNKTITPLLSYPNSTFTGGVTFEVSPTDVVSIESVTHPKDALTRCKITANKTASSVGKKAVITAIGKVNGATAAEDVYYYTTYEVTVTAENDCNFEWDGPTEYTLFKGDYMYIPGIKGNSNGNEQYSLGSYNDGTAHSYVYQIKNNSVTWWKNDGGEKYYKYREGYPNYQIVGNAAAGDPTTDKAYIFWVTGQGGDAVDTLMVYGNQVGDATLRATDPQNGQTCADITIHVVDKSSLTEATNNYVSGMSFPYTWDFTKNFDTSAFDNNNLYWTKKSNGDYSLGVSGAFNLDYADEDKDGKVDKGTEDTFKPFSNGSVILPQFYGMSISLGNSSTGSWFTKVDKIRIAHYTADGNPRFLVIGGTHKLNLPMAPLTPDAYRLYIKARGNTNKARIIFNDGSANTMYVRYLEAGIDKDGNTVSAGTVKTFTGHDYEQSSSDNRANWMKDVIIGYPVTAGENINLQLNGVDIYWIAFSTESKDITRRDGTSYPAASYSYNADLDFSYTDEMYGGAVTPYYASNFGSSTVTLSPLSSQGNQAPVNTGLVLKGASGANTDSYYMIAKSRNTDSYEAPSSLETNYLKGTGTSGMSVPRFIKSGETITHTNFALTNNYFNVRDDDDSFTSQEDAANYDWSFVRVNGSINAPAKMAFLQVSNRVGNIETSSRAMVRNESQDVNPASRSVLHIVFEDEQEATGIHTVSNVRTIDNDGWYSLQGVRVNSPSKGGLYIHNGKKVIVK